MKIDPLTGKAYLKEWQRDLDRIHHAGFSYGYVEIVDLVTGEHSWQVDAIKGDGARVVVEMPTLREAVRELAKAWSSPTEGSTKRRYYAVLHSPPVDIPEKAVRVAIVQDYKTGKSQ